MCFGAQPQTLPPDERRLRAAVCGAVGGFPLGLTLLLSPLPCATLLVTMGCPRDCTPQRVTPSENTCFFPTSASNFVMGNNSPTTGRRGGGRGHRSRAEAKKQKQIIDGTAGTCPSLPSCTRETLSGRRRRSAAQT